MSDRRPGRRGDTTPGRLRPVLDLLGWLALASLVAAAIALGEVLAEVASRGLGQ